MPCGPINNLDQVFDEPQAIARGLVVEQSRADLAEPVRTLASPVRMCRTPAAYASPAPTLGEHTAQVLGERLGLTAEDLAGLTARGVI